MYWIAISLAKLFNFVIRALRLGAGYTLPGHIALQLYPNLLNNAALFPQEGSIFVSATNGKTTTTKLISHILTKAGYSVVTNTSGANLLNGIASALLLATDLSGKARTQLAVFEVDEMALPLLLSFKAPKVLVLLNLSRDQLDRYGETDTILDNWVKSVANLPKVTTLVLDKTQPKLQSLSKNFAGNVLYFDASVVASKYTHLSGTFITKNVNAALSAVSVFGIDSAQALASLSDFTYAWGRGEKISAQGTDWTILLAKNPASFNFNLEELSSADIANFLIVLNDNIPDGRDVSWIYDIEANKLAGTLANKNIYLSGRRAYDIAVRLHYAGIEVPKNHIATDLHNVIGKVADGNYKEVMILPNYSAMLDVRKILTGRRIL
jgi:lipid II isoglutaminyl synthase (glutamine-hydrolysing)